MRTFYVIVTLCKLQMTRMYEIRTFKTLSKTTCTRETTEGLRLETMVLLFVILIFKEESSLIMRGTTPLEFSSILDVRRAAMVTIA